MRKHRKKTTTLRVDRQAAAALRRGHPWVYADGVEGKACVGDVVSLVDRDGGLVGWGLWDEGGIAVRVLSGEQMEIGAYYRKLVQRAELFRNRIIPINTDTYRLINGAGDGLAGVIVDRYGGVAVIRVYSAAHDVNLDSLVSALTDLPWVTSVFRRFGVRRVDGKTGGETLSGPVVPEAFVVTEHSVKFLVRPRVGQKTGLFLDQRENRRRIGELSAGRRVINLFGYNGGFSLYAALGGAVRVETVDLAGPALDDARENFRLNGIDTKPHAFIKADVFSWEISGKAGLVVCDPPSLTRNKKSDDVAMRAYRDLNARVAPMVTKTGLLATASCTARLSFEQWQSSVESGISRSGRWTWLEKAGAGPDHPYAVGHPDGEYLKFAIATKI